MPTNQFGQPIGKSITVTTPQPFPAFQPLQGERIRIEKLHSQHFSDLYDTYGPNSPLENWTYLPLEPLKTESDCHHFLTQLTFSTDPLYLAILDQTTNKALGTFSLMNIDTVNRVVEVGWVIFSPALQQTSLGTEAHFLLMSYVFEQLGYRRYEWKCDSLNERSKKAAQRLGFTYEGTFRQAAIYKGRSRDTDWFSIIDSEWREKKIRLETWLSPDNFTEQGQQKISLSSL